MSADAASIIARAKCLECFGPIPLAQAARIVLLWDQLEGGVSTLTAADIQSLLEYGKCFACEGMSTADVIELAILAQIQAGGGDGGGVPAGTIVMWSGTIASVPTGWAFCNGSNGTPDLRDQFVVAASADDAGVAKTNVDGGGLVKSGGTNIHDHGILSINGALDVGDQIADTSPAGVWGPTTLSSGITDVTNTLPPYYALAYIMKL